MLPPEIKMTRNHNKNSLPQTFSYRARPLAFAWNVLRHLLGIAIMVALFVGGIMLLSGNLSRTSPPQGWVDRAVEVVAIIFFCIFLPPQAIVQLALRLGDMLRRWRMRQQITTAQDQLIYEDVDSRLQTPWDEVMGYKKVGHLKEEEIHTVKTRQGSFDFSGNLPNVSSLLSVIRDRAINIPIEDWIGPPSPIIGGERSCWSGKEIGQGQHIFHYRNKIHRTMTWLPTTWCLWQTAGTILVTMAPPKRPEPFAILLLSASAIVLGLGLFETLIWCHILLVGLFR